MALCEQKDPNLTQNRLIIWGIEIKKLAAQLNMKVDGI
jgi:hypothetical protein